MEEVDGSNPSRSTKTFHTVSVEESRRLSGVESVWSPGVDSDQVERRHEFLSLGLSPAVETRQTRHLASKPMIRLSELMSGSLNNPTRNPTFNPTKTKLELVC